MSREQHLMPSKQRAERVQQKRWLVLRFLRDEIWTDARNVGELLKVKPAATYRSLETMVQDDLIRAMRLPVLGGCTTLWGITAHGQAMATLTGEAVAEKLFSPSRVSPTYARHTLDIQWLRIRAESVGWKDWIAADRVEKWAEGHARPDAFAIDPVGRRTALECERTIKSPKRYIQILNAWLQAIRRGDVQRVVWVAPSGVIRDRLRQIVTSITHVEVGGQSVLIPRDRFENLDFVTYSEWPKS